jgi:tetratricopeptide (TPR) repeat protein
MYRSNEMPDNRSVSQEQVVPHALVVARHAKRLGVNLQTVGSVLFRSGQQLLDTHQLDEAARAFEDAIAAFGETEGYDAYSVAVVRRSLADCLLRMGKMRTALGEIQMALEIAERQLGSDHVELAKFLNTQGAVLSNTEDWVAAERSFLRAIRLTEREEDPEYPVALNNLARLRHVLGDLQGAADLYTRALPLTERLYGHEHREVMIQLGNLGDTLRDIAEASPRRSAETAAEVEALLSTADRYCSDALELAKRLTGDRSYDFYESLSKVARVRMAQGRYETALRISEEALRLAQEILPLGNPEIGQALNHVGKSLRNLGRSKEALEAYKEALDIAKQAHGPYHLDVGIAYSNIGVALEALGQVKRAKRSYEQAYDVFRRVVGEEHRLSLLAAAKVAQLRRLPR